MNKPEKRFAAEAHFGSAADPLKVLTPDQFAALGADDVVFRRTMPAGELASIVPQAGVAPDDQMLELLMSADGAPVMIADTMEAVEDWIESHEVQLATLH